MKLSKFEEQTQMPVLQRKLVDIQSDFLDGVPAQSCCVHMWLCLDGACELMLDV